MILMNDGSIQLFSPTTTFSDEITPQEHLSFLCEPDILFQDSDPLFDIVGPNLTQEV